MNRNSVHKLKMMLLGAFMSASNAALATPLESNAENTCENPQGAPTSIHAFNTAHQSNGGHSRILDIIEVAPPPAFA